MSLIFAEYKTGRIAFDSNDVVSIQHETTDSQVIILYRNGKSSYISGTKTDTKNIFDDLFLQYENSLKSSNEKTKSSDDYIGNSLNEDDTDDEDSDDEDSDDE